jgi:hypothetical protein
MFCAPELIFRGTEGVGSCIHVLHSHTHFQRYRGRWVHYSCFELPDSFSVVPRASSSFFMYCASGHVLGGTEGVESSFHVLRFQTFFWRYRGRWVPLSYFAFLYSFCAVPRVSGQFSCFALLNSFWAVPRASGPLFMFCAPGLIFGDTEGVWSSIHFLRSRTHFWRNLGCGVPFSCFAFSDLFWVVPWV